MVCSHQELEEWRKKSPISFGGSLALLTPSSIQDCEKIGPSGFTPPVVCHFATTGLGKKYTLFVPVVGRTTPPPHTRHP
jgi:hypothetical protein